MSHVTEFGRMVYDRKPTSLVPVSYRLSQKLWDLYSLFARGRGMSMGEYLIFLLQNTFDDAVHIALRSSSERERETQRYFYVREFLHKNTNEMYWGRGLSRRFYLPQYWIDEFNIKRKETGLTAAEIITLCVGVDEKNITPEMKEEGGKRVAKSREHRGKNRKARA